jgi:hypothetical protein
MSVLEPTPPIPTPAIAEELPVSSSRRFGIANALVGALSLVTFFLLAVRYGQENDALELHNGGRSLIPMLLTGLIALYCLANLAIRPHLGTTRRLWASSITFTVLAIAGLAATWYLIFANHLTTPQTGVAMETQADVDRYLAANLPPGSHPLLVPTGIYVQSIEFESANNVLVSGYIWQKYDASVPKDITRGVVFPEAVASTGNDVTTEAYRYQDGSTEVIGWRFSATFRQRFDYRKYPLDRQDVRLRMWHADFNRGALLVPDLSSYGSWNPAELQGLEPTFVFGEWDPEFTAYSYALNQYKTNFGYGPYAARPSFPELYFSVGFKRDFRGPLFGHLVPTTIIALLVFATLFVTTMDELRRNLFGFNAFSVIAFCVTMLLVVVVDHNAIRSSVSARNIVYLEYFSFVLYFIILLVTINAILVTSPYYVSFLERRDNLFPKLFYWPMTIALLLGTTIIVFYA